MILEELQGSQILIFGAYGFIGCNLTDYLSNTLKCNKVYIADHRANLTSHELVNHSLESCKPDYVFNCAGWNGGLEFNQKYPADIYYENTAIALNVIHNCNNHKVKKVVSLAAS